MTPDCSVIIATRQRAESVRETLQALACQETAGGFTYEVLVVDNGSTDQTRRMVKDLQSRFPVPLRYRYEARLGKPWALNTGIREARGQMLAFTDDDVLPHATWLHALWRCCLEEEADGVSGRVLPRWIAPTPAWLTEDTVKRLGASLGCVDHGLHRLRSRQHPRGCWWVGGNMAVRRTVVQRIGGFDVRMDRAEDTQYYEQCLRHGLNVVYEPAALAYHPVGADRMTAAHFRRWNDVTGYYHAYLVPWKPAHLLAIMPCWWYRQMLGFGMAWLRALASRRPWVDRFYYELRGRRHLSLWFHRLQSWPWGLREVLRGRAALSNGLRILKTPPGR